MNGCEASRPLISAYVDGELVGEERAAFEAHVAACAACRRLLEEERAVVAAVKTSLPLFQAPPALRERVDGLVSAAPADAPRSFASASLVAAAAALVVVAAVLATSSASRQGRQAPASPFAALAAATHLRYARGQLPLEVATDQAETVSRWFAGRVPFHLELPDYPVGPGEQKFYHLEGGRLVSYADDYAAYVAYRMDAEPVSLLVASAESVRPAGGELLRSGGLTFHLESVAGLKVISWTDKGLTYALASSVAVSGARSCLVCHGSPAERGRVEKLQGQPRT